MRILFITPQVPFPPHQGTSIRNFGLISHLAQRHTVDLLSFRARGEELTPDSPLRRLCRRVAALPQPERTPAQRLRATLLSPKPDMALRLESAEMRRTVAAWLVDGDYDLVQVEGIELAQYAGAVDRRRTAVVFDDHNCEYLLQARNALTDLALPRRWHAAAYSLVQWAKLRRYEAAVCRSADAVLAVSGPDRDALARIAPAAAITVAANGIDLDAYTAPPARAPRDERFRVVFTGKMDYRPNIDAMLWFSRVVLPRLVAAVPNVLLQIVGMNPHPRLDALRLSPHVEITGRVADVRPYLYAADAYVIPMRVGGGTRFKALEAMAAARPIVSTTLGVEGIDVRHERELLLADTAPGFADAILHLAEDRAAGGALAVRLGAAAHAFVGKYYTWERIVPTVEQVYADLIARCQGR
jgi:sugar transferase (PEP-CTERM/EpsH1 system associated)